VIVIGLAFSVLIFWLPLAVIVISGASLGAAAVIVLACYIAAAAVIAVEAWS
jgi:hypothetical protein